MNKNTKVYVQSISELFIFFLLIDALLFYITKGSEFFLLTKNITMYIGVSLLLALFLLFSVSWQYKKMQLMTEEEIEYYKNPPWKKIIITAIVMGLGLSLLFVYLSLDKTYRTFTWISILWVVFTLFYLIIKAYVFRFYKLMRKSSE
jgi:multisubunit Na+/H+ antiporter MnhC subunit